jgi:tetratricopeptide (TPR) repeat protein
MPVSTGIFITSALIEIEKLRPESVLDVGCGFGLWGFLCRMYLDVFPGRRGKEQWRTRIEGVEAFAKYIMPHQEFLYDKIHIGEIQELFDQLGEFDLYIFGDILEHLPKQDGTRVLESAYRKAGKGILINVPLGEGWLREGNEDNPYEAHVSVWDLADFAEYCPRVCHQTTFPDVGRYALILIDKTLPQPQTAEQLCQKGRFYLEGSPEAAARCFRRAIDTGCEKPEAHFELANLLLQDRKMDEAIEVLRHAIAQFPDQDAPYDVLGKLLFALNRGDEAREVLASRPGLSNME